MTVSRALKNPAQVLPEARARVEAAVAALGYVPSHAARTLASSRSRVVAVLVPSLSNEVFVDTLAGIQDCLGPAGYQFLIGNTNYSADKQAELVSTYLAHAPDGFLVTGIDGSGFAGLPLTGTLSGALGPVVGVDPATLAAVGQMGAVWTGGGTLIAWSSLIAVAGFARVHVLSLVRALLLPVVVALVISTICAVLIWS